MKNKIKNGILASCILTLVGLYSPYSEAQLTNIVLECSSLDDAAQPYLEVKLRSTGKKDEFDREIVNFDYLAVSPKKGEPPVYGDLVFLNDDFWLEHESEYYFEYLVNGDDIYLVYMIGESLFDLVAYQVLQRQPDLKIKGEIVLSQKLNQQMKFHIVNGFYPALLPDDFDMRVECTVQL